MVQYYRDLRPKRSEKLAPLIDLTKGGPIKKIPIGWNTDCTKAFKKMKALIYKETIFAYLDFLKKNTQTY